MIRACPKEDILSAFPDQALSQFQMDRVQRHLQTCAVCRNRLATLTDAVRQTDEMIRGLPQMSPSPGFDDAFWEKLAVSTDKRKLPLWLERVFYDRRPVFAAAMTVILLAVLVLFPSDDPAPTAEEVFIADHMEMFEELELIERLDLLENWESIQAMEEHG